MATYPGTLPNPRAGTYSEQADNVVIRTQMEAGVDKVRQRFSSGVTNISFELFLSAAQVTTLDDFYRTTVKNGSLSFTYTHPRTAASVTARFTKPISYDINDHGNYIASVEMEILP
jgi:hypothetical protein